MLYMEIEFFTVEREHFYCLLRPTKMNKLIWGSRARARGEAPRCPTIIYHQLARPTFLTRTTMQWPRFCGPELGDRQNPEKRPRSEPYPAPVGGILTRQNRDFFEKANSIHGLCERAFSDIARECLPLSRMRVFAAAAIHLALTRFRVGPGLPILVVSRLLPPGGDTLLFFSRGANHSAEDNARDA